MVAKRTDLNNTEIIAFRKIFAMEGGFRTVYHSDTMAGITSKALAAAKNDPKIADKLKDIHVPTDLKGHPELVLDIYKSYFEASLAGIGKYGLVSVGNVYAAAALADTIFREGRGGGTHILRLTVEAMGAKIDRKRPAFIQDIFSAYSQFAKDSATLGKLLDNLAIARKNGPFGKETPRIDYFRFLSMRSK
jgi:hypothetical protein